LSSFVQVRTKERGAAFATLYVLLEGNPLFLPAEAMSTIGRLKAQKRSKNALSPGEIKQTLAQADRAHGQHICWQRESVAAEIASPAI
jgi:hypothetical protein